jgi:addiction module RelE/StbE family toxin
MELKWTRGALQNLDSIASYIALDNPIRAQCFVRELKEKVESLQDFQIGRAGRVFGTKEYVLHKNYIVIYRVQNDQLQILRIQHAAQNR